MAHKDEYLPYTIHLNDLNYYNSRFITPANPGAEVEADPPNDKLFRSPQDAANTYGADLALLGASVWPGGALPIQFDPRDAFSSPSVRSTWFGSSAPSTEDQFPLDQVTFVRKSGGWFGISWLFGTKTTYHWVGRFEYSPKVGAGVPGTVVALPMPRRRWIDGGELPLQGEGGSSATADVSRRASRSAQGYGYTFDSTLGTKLHDHTESGAAASPSAWERIYVRLVRFPDNPTRIWRVSSTISAAGPMITITAGGALTLNDFDGVSTATPIGSMGTLLVNVWYKLDLVYSFGALGASLPYFKAYLNGTKVIDVVGAALPGMQGGTKNCSQSIIGGGTPAGGANNAIWHADDWIGSDVPAVGYEIGTQNDFIVGSHVAVLGANAFASDSASWTGDWRLTRQRPVTTGVAQQLTSSVSGAILGVVADAAVEVDGQSNQQGVVAICVGLFSDKGGAGANGDLGWKLPGGANDFAAVVQTAGSFSWTSRLYRPAGLVTPLTPLEGLELKHRKGASVDPAKVQALMAVAEIIGVFGDEDVYPQSALGTPIAQPAASVQTHFGIHNAPYPHTPWCKDMSTAPQGIVVVKTGQYVGTGTFLDLKFRAPVHFLWIRPESGGSGGLIWFSSMNAAHRHGTRAYMPEGLLEVLIDPTFVQGDGVETDMTLPEAPDNLEEAIALSNQLAFGFHKNDASYIGWAPYLDDPVYFFGRMLGSGSEGGPDEAVAGLYAVPPTPWLSTQQQQTIIRLAGNDADVNAAGVNYNYLAFCDPSMAYSQAGALAAYAFNGDILSDLDVESFVPEAVLLQQEQDGASSAQTFMVKGSGSAANAISVPTLAEIASGLAMTGGVLTYKNGLLLAGANQHAYIAFRRAAYGQSTATNRPIVLASYTGDGGGTKIIPLTPTGKRPMWVLIVGHNGTTFMRDPFHTGTNSLAFPSTNNAATGITAGAVDSITVGSAANTNGIIFDVIAFMGCSAGVGNNGWGEIGECIPDDPESPPEPPWDPPPEPPVEPPEPPFDPGPAADDFGNQCIAASTRIINQALSRIGVSKQIGNIVTEQSNEANVARLHYSDDVDQTLRDFPWPFATHYATLARIAGPSPVASPDWLYSYRRPSDCVFERRICLPRQLAVDPTPPPFQLSNDPDVMSIVVALNLTGNSAANPTVFTVAVAHGFVTGQVVTIAGVVGSVPDVNGAAQVTVIDPTHFSIPVTVSNPGVGGTVTPQAVLLAAGGGLILTNQANAVLEYTHRPVCAAGRGDPLFRDALTWRHAASLASSLSRMTDVQANCLKMYQACIDLAHAVFRPGNPGRPATTASTLDTTAAQLAANTAVINRGLLRIGAQTVTAIESDQSREATAVRAIFEDELLATLRDHSWAFATAYADLALVGGTVSVPVNADWQYSYRLPTDYAKARRLVNEVTRRAFDENPVPFRIGGDAAGGLLFTNQEATTDEPVTLEYTARFTGLVSRSDALFRDAFAWRLAAALAPAIANVDPERVEQHGRGAEDPREVQGKTPRADRRMQLRMQTAQYALRMYAAVIRIAEADNSQEQQQEKPGDAEWTNGRN
jgi:hypothetical protein